MGIGKSFVKKIRIFPSESLNDYLPKELYVGPYTYNLIIGKLNDTEETSQEGECCFESKTITLSENLDFSFDEPNWELTIEVLIHEILHAYNYNAGIHSEYFGFKNKSVEVVEECFVDLASRHFVMMLKQNPLLFPIINLIADPYNDGI